MTRYEFPKPTELSRRADQADMEFDETMTLIGRTVCAMGDAEATIELLGRDLRVGSEGETTLAQERRQELDNELPHLILRAVRARKNAGIYRHDARII